MGILFVLMSVTQLHQNKPQQSAWKANCGWHETNQLSDPIGKKR